MTNPPPASVEDSSSPLVGLFGIAAADDDLEGFSRLLLLDGPEQKKTFLLFQHLILHFNNLEVIFPEQKEKKGLRLVVNIACIRLVLTVPGVFLCSFLDDEGIEGNAEGAAGVDGG